MGIEEATDFALRELDHLLHTISDPRDTAAFIIEPVLGEGGYLPTPARFLHGLRERADRHGILLILDEVQTGAGRTGRFWAQEHSGVLGDILVTAKGIASGFPLSAMAASADRMAARTAPTPSPAPPRSPPSTSSRRRSWSRTAAAGAAPRLPVPHFNVLNGGVHAPNPLDFQEFMVAPLGAPSVAEAVRAGAEVYAALRQRLAAGGHSTGLGDEGGFAPQLATPEEVLTLITAAIADAGYAAGPDGVAIALDPAASEFRGDDGRYSVGEQRLSSTETVELYAQLVADFPIWSIEDGVGDGGRDEGEHLLGGGQLGGEPALVAQPGAVPARGQPLAQRRIDLGPGPDR